MDASILASLGKFIQPLFTPLGFGTQLSAYGWVFAVAAVTGLIAKENVIATFYTLACCLIAAMEGETILNIDPEIIQQILAAGEASEEGIIEAVAMIQATGITIPALIAFIAFNMTTIPCFAACATAKAELKKGTFIWTLLFWIVVSYVVSAIVFVVGTWWWTIFIFLALFVFTSYLISLFNKKRDSKKVVMA